ncbi:hypothetical protein V1511DRAFT_492909 [Dipodascopsis uninucleata]
MVLSTGEVCSLYRHILRTGRRIVKRKAPYKYLFLDITRNMFRDPQLKYDSLWFKNTLSMLQRAEEYRGMEHRVVKNILHTAWSRQFKYKQRSTIGASKLLESNLHSRFYNDFDLTVRMLCHSMKVYLPDKAQHYTRTFHKRS